MEWLTSPCLPPHTHTHTHSENDFNDTSDIKRKKLASQTDRTHPATATAKGRRSSELLKITEEDLQHADVELSAGYWRELAERRRLALDETLTENQELHDMNTSLKEQLDVSNQMLDESRNLVEILTEMLEEGEAAGTTQAGGGGGGADAGYERGECSKSFLNASIAEEAAEEVGVQAVASSDDATDDEGLPMAAGSSMCTEDQSRPCSSSNTANEDEADCHAQ